MISHILMLDASLPAGTEGGAGSSLLTLPLGRSTLLGELAAQAAPLNGTNPLGLWVRTREQVDEQFAEDLALAAGRDIGVLDGEARWIDWLGQRAPQERVLVCDAGRWPAGAFELARLVRRYDNGEGVLHLTGSWPVRPGARERVERDERGNVTRVQRVYGVTAADESAPNQLFASVVPASLLRGIRFETLPELHAALEGAPIECLEAGAAVEVLDLRRVEGWLALNECMLTEQFERATSHRADQGRVLMAAGSHVADGARVVGQVILHEGARIQSGATVVGPAVIGRDAMVESGATVIQAVLGHETHARAGETLRHCVAAGNGPAVTGTNGHGANHAARAAALDGARQTWPGLAAPPPIERGRRIHFAIKRAIDVVISLVALVLLSPLFAVVAVLIKRTNPGPVFFLHKRETRGGEEFSCVKFRTMEVGADARQAELAQQNEVDGPQFKIRDDPRVTRIGEWLRGTNIDELPQLFNVLAGHMSLVGPRPSPFKENQICVPWRRARLSVRPGITGLWQICRSADRSGGDFHEWIFYDIAYVRHFSIWLDIKIMVATVLTRGGRKPWPLSRLIGEERARAPFTERDAG